MKSPTTNLSRLVVFVIFFFFILDIITQRVLDAIFRLDWKSVGKKRCKPPRRPSSYRDFHAILRVSRTDFRTRTYFHHPDKYRYVSWNESSISPIRGVDMHSVFNLLVISLNKHTARRRTDSLKLFCTHSHAIKKLHFSSPVYNPPPHRCPTTDPIIVMEKSFPTETCPGRNSRCILLFANNLA